MIYSLIGKYHMPGAGLSMHAGARPALVTNCRAFLHKATHHLDSIPAQICKSISCAAVHGQGKEVILGGFQSKGQK